MKKILLIIAAIVALTTMVTAKGIGSAEYVEKCKTIDKKYCTMAGSLLLKEDKAEEAEKILLYGCENNHAKSCGLLGNVYARKAGEEDKKNSFKYFLRGCELNEPLACFGAGENLAYGVGVKQDFKRAKLFFEKSSAGGVALAYASIGKLYARGAGVEKNFVIAIEYVDKACVKGDYASCTEAGVAYLTGDGGVKKDKDKGLKYIIVSCSRGKIEKSCELLTKLTGKSRKELTELFKKK
jgi:TPR repeat protein